MTAILKINGLRKDFVCPDRSAVTIVDVPELCISTGEQLVLTGPSGSGKTTLLHLIAGLSNPTSGEIFCGGVRIDALQEQEKDQWRAECVGYIFQKLNLLDSLTVLENVMLGGFFSHKADRRILREEAMVLLRRVGLEKKSDSKPKRLSLGEQQRAAVARALLKRPAFLLADEPTASLDRKNVEIVMEMLRTLCAENKATLILSTHDPVMMKEFPHRYDLQMRRRLS